VHYINPEGDTSICLAVRFTCAEGQAGFSDECGCGCVDVVTVDGGSAGN
jgi:hypothetical protein